MHASVLRWGESILTREFCEGKLFLEVGSYNVNGSLRGYATRHDNIRGYIGVDLQYGPGVDLVADITSLATFGCISELSFDVIICTEMLEHVYDYASALLNMTSILRLGGTLLLTTRSEGFPYHPYPDDHWRYSRKALHGILEYLGYTTGTVINDAPESPGVLACVTLGLRGTVLMTRTEVLEVIRSTPGVTRM